MSKALSRSKPRRRFRGADAEPGTQVTSADVYAINLVKTEYREGYNTGDVDRVLSAFADGFLYFSEGTPSFGGPESKLVLAAQARELFRKFDVKMAVVIALIQVFGNSAYDWGWHELTLTPRDGGGTRKLRKRYIELWQKEAGGSWKISFLLDNNDLPPVMVDSYLRSQCNSDS